MPATRIFDAHPLFEDVQLSRVFPDGKTFVDCIPKQSLEAINEDYQLRRAEPGFDLQQFIFSRFIPPSPYATGYHSDNSRTVEQHIEQLWDVLTRLPDKEKGSLIPLPHPYIVPGGRFGEIYYWDSYFTMLGLKASGKTGMIENMINNFSWLIDQFGYIPNGNRSYFIGRSQPPFYSLMIQLLAGIKGEEVFHRYLPQLEKEYRFWMNGAEELPSPGSASHHIVKMPGGELLNRYWDEHDIPRPESYREDIELSKRSKQDPRRLFRHLRAGAESGWDYSCRWFSDITDFGTIHTADIVPVDLNALLWHLEKTIAESYRLKGDFPSSDLYHLKAERRKNAIQHYCWNKEAGFFFDFDLPAGRQKSILTLAAVTPLYFNIATSDQSRSVAKILESSFLHPGGLANSLHASGQQWDAPNGWAPMHWMAITGLENYGHQQLATRIARRWIKLNTDVFTRTGKLMEKYNVVDTRLEAGGGEYEGQDGFGWTNGVLLALLKKYGPG